MTTTKTINREAATPDDDKAKAHDDMTRTPGQRRSEVRLGRETQARIGQQLRSLYDEVVNEGVPEHIADLIHRLSDQDDGAA